MFKCIDKIVEYLYLKQDGNLAYYDTLTKVNNRLFYDRVIKQKYLGRECFVIFIDIDELKFTNDTKGHYEGDKLILSVVEQLKKIRYIDYIIRYGGDEFILIGDKILKEDLKLLNNVSYGVSIKAAYEDMSSAISKADGLMYAEKEKKKMCRNYFTY